ncbi:armadillo-type protein [Glomus cerebriforme]|uniref:Armadillo-type protein n=1 Tax=Glomus cerebriforme TaxID=658196 RepID=A0A397TNX3_9GLOM|nr:armadillo-type protein [Glomus cerebriforme]
MGRVPNKKKSRSAKSSIMNNVYNLDLEDEVDNITDSQVHSSRSLAALPVIKQLSSVDSTERAWAASCASNLIAGEENIRRLLLSKNLIRLLIERLTDDVYEVVYECIGTLRNLTAIGEYEICAEMFNKDILTPLMMLISKISTIIDNLLKGISYESDPIEGARKNIWIFTENIICILWALSETSQKALRRINNMNIVPFLMDFFTHIEKIPPKTVVAAAQCLHTMTDDNSDIYIQFQQNPQYAQILLNVVNLEINETSTNLNDNHLLMKVLCCGVILNLDSIIISTVTESDFNIHIINYLKSCLDYDIESAANDSIELASNIGTSKFVTKHPKDDLPTAEEEKLISINSRLTTLQLALELLTKICLEWFSQDDDNLQDEAQNDYEIVTDNFNKIMDIDDSISNNYDQSLLNRQEHLILNTFATDIIPNLIRLSRPTSLSYPEQLGHNVIPVKSVAPTITESLATVHLRAVECMNNFFLAMVDIVEEKWWFIKHRDAAKDTWTRLVEVAKLVAGKGIKVGAEDPGQKMRGAVLEALIGCLWTLARGLNGDLLLAENQILAFIQCYKSTISESMRVKLIGTLGAIARRQNAIEDNKLIGTFLIEIIQDLSRTNSPSIDCIAESLNAIYDVYADKDFDYDEPVFVREGYLNILESIVNNVHNMAESIDKQKSRDQRFRMDEVYINLVAFIKYKKDERFIK